MPTEPVILVGGVSQLYQGDLDLGRRLVDRLAAEDLGPDVLVEDLHYGAVAVAQRLEDLRPAALILLGAEPGERVPGTVQRRRVELPPESMAEFQSSVADAVTGYVTIDLVVEVAAALGVLPARTVTIEVEPATIDPAEELSPVVAGAVDEVVRLVRTEIRCMRVCGLVDTIRCALADGHLEPSPSAEALEQLLDELERAEWDGRWGRVFAERDRLRLRIGDGEISEAMTHLDWGLWWTLIEELDRIQALEVDGAA